MNLRQTYAFAIASATLIIASGCAVTRGQESVGAYVDDTAITTAVKARFIDNTNVDAASRSASLPLANQVLSGFAKNGIERGTAETLAWKVGGVKAVKNEIAVRP